MGRGRALELKGELDAAAADYNEVVKLSTGGEMANIDSSLAAAYYGLGSIAMQQDKPKEAIDVLLKALAIKRTDADTMALLGSAYVKAGAPDKAVEPLRRAIMFVPVGWVEPYQTLAAAYTASERPGPRRALEFKGELNGAAADYQEVVELSINGEMATVDAGLARAYYGLGSIALQQDKPQEAVDQLLKALAIKRTDADTMNLLGAAYVKAGQPDKAIEPLAQAILFVPVGWAEPYQTLADAYTATGDAELAEWADAMAAGTDRRQRGCRHASPGDDGRRGCARCHDRPRPDRRGRRAIPRPPPTGTARPSRSTPRTKPHCSA